VSKHTVLIVGEYVHCHPMLGQCKWFQFFFLSKTLALALNSRVTMMYQINIVLCFLVADSPTFEFYMLMFQNTVSVPSS